MSRPPRPPARAHARSLRYGLVLAVLLAVPTLWSPLPADALGGAAEPDPRQESMPSASPDTVTWGVTPANETGPDGRRSVSANADPEDQWQDHLAVRNVGAVDAVFRLSAADGYLTETGRFNTLPPGEDSVDAGTWITLPDSVHVPAGGTVVVPFTVSIPRLAEPGDHAAGISASLGSVSAADGTGVGVESRVGFRVTIRVSGKLAPTASLDILGADYATSWNPFAPGEMRVRLAVANTGNVRFTAQGTAVAGSGAAVFPTAGDDRHEFLPGDSREVDVVIPRVWPTFLVPVSVVLAPGTVAIDGAAVPMASSVHESWAWAVPWPQGAVIMGLVLLTVALAGDRLRRRRRLDALLAAAREDGRRDAHRGGAEQ